MGQKRSFFKLGLIVGAIGGALGGLFFAPKKGKELRADAKKRYLELRELMKEKGVDEKVKKIYGEVTKTTKDHYQRVHKELVLRLSALKEGIDAIDKKKYSEIVDEVLANIKKEPGKTSQRAIVKLKQSLKEDWQLLSTKISLREKTEGKQ